MEESNALKGHRNAITSLAFASDSQTLASGDADGLVLIHDVKLWAARKPTASAELKPEKLAGLWGSLRKPTPPRHTRRL